MPCDPEHRICPITVQYMLTYDSMDQSPYCGAHSCSVGTFFAVYAA